MTLFVVIGLIIFFTFYFKATNTIAASLNILQLMSVYIECQAFIFALFQL
jgi:hypothetical protein